MSINFFGRPFGKPYILLTATLTLISLAAINSYALLGGHQSPATALEDSSGLLWSPTLDTNDIYQPPTPKAIPNGLIAEEGSDGGREYVKFKFNPNSSIDGTRFAVEPSTDFTWATLKDLEGVPSDVEVRKLFEKYNLLKSSLDQFREELNTIAANAGDAKLTKENRVQ